jgi:hypothetical protein
MKVKELKGDIKGTKIRIPKQFEDDYSKIKGVMYLHGVWQAGVWLKKSLKEDDTRIYPLCIDPRKVLEFNVVK